jgi:glycosyltransferase involved in cell wall biosynthesis
MKSACYVLSYYAPDYIRTRTLVDALRRLENLKFYEARNSSKGILRYFETLWKLIVIRVLHDPQFYILGFRGYELYWFVRLITLGRTLIFDHMMSPYDSLTSEYEIIDAKGFIGKLVYFYERKLLLNSDVVLTDTDLHKRYFQGLFRITPSKIVDIPVGTDENLFHPVDHPLPLPDTALFEVLYYGSFLPLHGIDLILNAASRLRKFQIHFTLIGGNRLDLSGFHRAIKELDLHNVTHINWVEFEDLPQRIARAHLGLGGPFGNTGQARRVITGKTFQFLAMAKPVIIGEIDDDCGFVDSVNCLLVPQKDPSALADAILWAFQHQAELDAIGYRGRELYQARYSIECITEKLRETLTL